MTKFGTVTQVVKKRVSKGSTTPASPKFFRTPYLKRPNLVGPPTQRNQIRWYTCRAGACFQGSATPRPCGQGPTSPEFLGPTFWHTV